MNFDDHLAALAEDLADYGQIQSSSLNSLQEAAFAAIIQIEVTKAITSLVEIEAQLSGVELPNSNLLNILGIEDDEALPEHLRRAP